MPNKLGVLYVVWNNQGKITDELQRSIDSVKKQGLPYHVVQSYDSPPYCLSNKALMYDLSPFENTLFLDSDTEVLGDLTYGFRQSERHGIACCIDHSWNMSRWCGKDHPILSHTDIVEYNTGVIFFTKNDANAKLFDQWKKIVNMHPNDQATFGIAVDQCNINPFVLPAHVWNYRVYNGDRLWGPVKIWHTKKPHVLTDSIRKALTTDHGNKWYEVPEIKQQNPSDWANNVLRV